MSVINRLRVRVGDKFWGEASDPHDQKICLIVI